MAQRSDIFNFAQYLFSKMKRGERGALTDLDEIFAYVAANDRNAVA
jgi:hypothetical protein